MSVCQELGDQVVPHWKKKLIPTHKNKKRGKIKKCVAMGMYFNSKSFMDSVVFN